MIAAVIALSVLALTLGGGLVYAMKLARDERNESKAAGDLYRKQQEITLELETDRRDLTAKLAATDAQLREATIRLEKTEQQRNQALAEARESIRREIRNAPDAIAAVNKVLATAPGSVRQPGKAETETTKPATGAGDSGSDPLLATKLL